MNFSEQKKHLEANPKLDPKRSDIEKALMKFHFSFGQLILKILQIPLIFVSKSPQ